MKLNEFIEGWKNNLLPKADEKEFIELVSAERMKICEECPRISTKHKTMRPDVHCTECSCTLAAKTRCLICECPLHKWLAINKEDNGQQQESNNSLQD